MMLLYQHSTGYKESAFALALLSGGVAYSVAKSCSQGRIISCGCEPIFHQKRLTKSLQTSLKKERKRFLDPSNASPFVVDKNLERLINQLPESNDVTYSHGKPKQRLSNRWKWSGCSHNVDYGIEFSQLFLDSKEKASDMQSKINLHNNFVGRQVVKDHMQVS